jgi:hypothetical protein
MKFFSRLMTLVILFMGIRCGVHVGNGTKEYRSPYGYSFSYAENLTLKESPDKKKIEISNEGVVGSNEPVSHLTIQVDDTQRVSTAAELDRMARNDHYVSYVEPKPVNLGGFVGVFKSRGLDNGLREVYFLIGAKDELMKINLAAFNLGKGVELMSQLVKSVKKSN